MPEKKKKISVFRILLAFLTVFLAGCGIFGSDSDDDAEVLPGDLDFSLYPNDPAANDSVSANLALGVMLTVHPNASYELSFDADSSRDAPKLQLYRLIVHSDSYYLGKQTRNLDAIDSAGRWIYRFTCKESDRAYWAATLANGSSRYSGAVRNLSFSGTGAYEPRFSLNLIVVGSYGGTSDSVSLDSLSRLLLAKFRAAFASDGVAVDTLYVHHASERTDLSTSYPDNKPWLAGKSSSDFFLTELGGWPDSLGEKGVYGALDLVLVHRIESEGVLGYSSLFGASLGGGYGSTVVIGTQYYISDESVEYSQEADDIASTAVHESGHFFGLRHTTSTRTDQESTGDYSNIEDGIEDTPYCGGIINAKTVVLPKVAGNLPIQAAPRTVLAKSVSDCPDASNPMFPTSVDVETGNFTDGQISMLKKNLEICNH